MDHLISRIWIVLGILGILYFIVLLQFPNSISFSKFFLLFGILIIIWGLYRLKIYNLLYSHNLKFIIYFFKTIIVLVLISFVIIEAFIIRGGKKTKAIKEDYIIILGAGLNGDTPSLSLCKRLEKSLEYINHNPDAKIIVSGGQGSGETIAEAEAMKRYLLNNGVSKERIIKEDKSRTTMQNLKFTRNKIDELDKSNKSKKIDILIITSDFHMFRAKKLAEKFGFNPYGVSSKTILILKPNFYVREYLAVLKFIISK